MSWLTDIFSLPVDRSEPPLPEPVPIVSGQVVAEPVGS